MDNEKDITQDPQYEGRKEAFMDEDRMINEGLGGGLVTEENGLIEETTTDTMVKKESIMRNSKEDK